METMPKKTPNKKTDQAGRVQLIEDPAEIGRWEGVAESQGLSLSAWIRMVCRAAVRKAEGGTPS